MNGESIKAKERILLTAALPYANGNLHLGHVLEFIQTDIYARFLRLQGKDVAFVCASDMHGTPIEINAKKAGKTPEEFVSTFWQSHQDTAAKYLISFDEFHKTHSPENKEFSELFFKTLKEKDLIYLQEIQQMYDETAKRFLPDRFIKGNCPKCNAPDQYGDVCENCGATYNTTDLVNPYSTITKTTPILKSTKHYFFKLSKFQTQLKAWIQSDQSGIQSQIAKWLLGWIEKGLGDWCISRDAPYFGFEIPGSAQEAGAPKYFYVWLDAPIGYLSSTKHYCQNNHLAVTGKKTWESYWNSPNSQVIHLIGKDIVYFHFLFWPAMLLAMGLPLPQLNVHGFVTAEGKKMSKSRGTAITADEFYDQFGAEQLRFYFASHLSSQVLDVDLSLTEFAAVSNNVLMANLANFCFRSLSFAAKKFPGGIELPANSDSEQTIEQHFARSVPKIITAYYELELKTAVKEILSLSDLANQYFQKAEPWRVRDTPAEQEQVARQVSFSVNLARNLAILVKPILPELVKKIEHSLGLDALLGSNDPTAAHGLTFEEISFSWQGVVKAPARLLEKIELAQKEEPEIPSFPLDIRVGQITAVSDHPDSERIYVLQVNFGGKIGSKQVLAGVKQWYGPDDLLNLKALFCVNLETAMIRGQKSEAMGLMVEDKAQEQPVPEYLPVPETTVLGTQVTVEGYEVSADSITLKQLQKAKLKVVSGKVGSKGNVLLLEGQEISLPHVADGSKIK